MSERTPQRRCPLQCNFMWTTLLMVLACIWLLGDLEKAIMCFTMKLMTCSYIFQRVLCILSVFLLVRKGQVSLGRLVLGCLFHVGAIGRFFWFFLGNKAVGSWRSGSQHNSLSQPARGSIFELWTTIILDPKIAQFGTFQLYDPKSGFLKIFGIFFILQKVVLKKSPAKPEVRWHGSINDDIGVSPRPYQPFVCSRSSTQSFMEW